MWMKPPKVYDETIPNNHRIINTTKIVQSIEHLQIIRTGSLLPVHERHGSINASFFVLSCPVGHESARR
jgi:hypothetical protein